MTTLRHGKLELQVPDGWLDQSTLLFVAPRPAVEPVPAPAVTSSLSVRFGPAGKRTPRQLIEEETSGLSLVQPLTERVSEGAFESPLGVGWLNEMRLTLTNVPVAQLAVGWVVGEYGIVACAACGARELAAERPKLESLLRAIRL